MAPKKEATIAWKQLSRASWQRRSLPGVAVIMLIVLLRMLGLFQGWEWKTLDMLLRLRPAESVDDRLLIVGIDETDIQAIGTYPVPDENLAELIDTLTEQEPRAIGIDIFRDLPVPPGHDRIADTFANNEVVFVMEKILDAPIPPPPTAPSERVGFIDFPLDEDGFVRRTFLGAFPPPEHPETEDFHLSFPLVLAQAYLDDEGLTLGNGVRNPNNMAFGDQELMQFQPNHGGYVGANAAGIQMLINVRSGQSPFAVVSMRDVLQGKVDATLIRDRVVLVGITSLSNKDLVNSAAVNTANPGLFFGIEMHAHVTSQILGAVLDDRPLLTVWSDGWEYVWIVLWGGVGMLLVRFIPKPTWYVLAVACIGLGLAGLSFVLLWLGGWWVPLIPTLIAFVTNGFILPGFYLYDQTLRSRIAERQSVIEETYDAIHNGPLQTLALVLRKRDRLDDSLNTQLTELNQELRAVYNRLREETLPAAEQLRLGSQRVIDVRHDLHEVLYEVYTETIQRQFPGFESIKFQVVKFEPMQETGLTTEERRSLCRLLEEMLCNVGKHAVKAKRLTVACYATDTENIIQVADNGQHCEPPSEAGAEPSTTTAGRGTQQAIALAQKLGGSFQRHFTESGACCEFCWPFRVRRSWWRQ